MVVGRVAAGGAPDGGLIKVGTGTITLSAGNSYIGNTAISNGTLAVNGSLSNGTVTVTVAGTSSPLESVYVCDRASGTYGGCAYTNEHGEYTIEGLAATEYTVEFTSYAGNYLTQYYNGK